MEVGGLAEIKRPTNAEAEEILRKREVELIRELEANVRQDREALRSSEERLQRAKGGQPDELAILTTAELLSLEFPEPRWLIEGLLPAEGISMLAGDWGCWKSWFITHGGLAIAAGRRFIGLVPTTQARVLILALEGGLREHQRRVLALTRSAELPSDLPIFHFAAGALRFEDPKARELLAGALRKFTPDLVITDNMRIAFGGNEDGSEFARDALLFVDEMQSAHPSTWLFVHHENKWADTRQGRGKKVRGSTGIPANLGSLLQVERTSDDTGILHHVKSRYGKESPPLKFQFSGPEVPGGAGFAYLGAPDPDAAVAAPAPIDIEKAMLAELEGEPSGTLTRAELFRRVPGSEDQKDRAVARLASKDSRVTKGTQGRAAVISIARLPIGGDLG